MEASISLPRIREDLNLYPGPSLRDGSPSWTLHDPLRNRYFRIGWQEFELLSRFHLRSAARLVEELQSIGISEGVEERISRLTQFLKKNELVESVEPQNTVVTQEQSLLSSLLFLKIPLFHPDRLLSKIYPLLRGLFHPVAGHFLLVVALFSLLMVVQQSELFFATFTEFQSPAGVVIFLAAILFSKAVHEMGHALMAKHYGLQVPTFGVAFLFFWPVFYTDSSDGWKLRSRRARLLIGGAGVMAETVLAIIATLGWLWLSDGLLRSVAFTVAVTTWGMTLLINLNPLMRFDGYFLLADWWEVPNLQGRAFALGRAQLRSLLLGVGAPQPPAGEDQRQKRQLIGYAWVTWAYRLALYLGLALVAYHYLFKLLGVLLLIMEMGVLVAQPVIRELKQYWQLRDQFRWVRSNRVIFTVLLAVLLGLLLPWKSSVEAPAIWKQGELYPVYATEPARVVQMEVSRGDLVAAGGRLIDLQVPALEYELAMLQEQIAEQHARLRSGEMAERSRQQRLVEMQKLEQLRSKIDQVNVRLKAAQITSPIGGEVARVAPELMVGEWVSAGDFLFSISDQQASQVEGWFHERDLWRVKEGAHGQFFPEYGEGGSIPVMVESVTATGSVTLEDSLLSSIHGGPLPVRIDAQQESHLQESYYRVVLVATGPLSASVGELRGVVVIDAEPSTILSRWWKWLESMLVRESGI